MENSTSHYMGIINQLVQGVTLSFGLWGLVDARTGEAVAIEMVFGHLWYIPNKVHRIEAKLCRAYSSDKRPGCCAYLTLLAVLCGCRICSTDSSLAELASAPCLSRLLISWCSVHIICLGQKSILNGRLLLSHPIMSLFVKNKCQSVERSHGHIFRDVSITCSPHPALWWLKVQYVCADMELYQKKRKLVSMMPLLSIKVGIFF